MSASTIGIDGGQAHGGVGHILRATRGWQVQSDAGPIPCQQVPTARVDHASAVANLVLDMFTATQSIQPLDGAPVELRIGISSGPVVAGGIGDKRFGYDLWGDTVNVASRMEASDVPGRIQVSEETYRRLADRYHLAPRGEIEVKGLGPMATWYLLGSKADS